MSGVDRHAGEGRRERNFRCADRHSWSSLNQFLLALHSFPEPTRLLDYAWIEFFNNFGDYMTANDTTCQQKVLSNLTEAGVMANQLSQEMLEWIRLSCFLGMPDQEISGFLVRTLDLKCVLESIASYDLTSDELAELKKDFFAGKLSMKDAVDTARAKSDQKAKSPAKTTNVPKGHGKGSSG